MDESRALVQVDGGVKLSYLAKYVARYGLKGIESLVGIPGSVGGSIAMNAGAEGTEVSQVLRSIKVMTLDGEIKVFNKDEIKFASRQADFSIQRWNNHRSRPRSRKRKNY